MTISVGKAAQLAKGGASNWIHDTFPDKWAFSWQESYGAFSVSVSRVGETIEYIRNQAAHHPRTSFK